MEITKIGTRGWILLLLALAVGAHTPAKATRPNGDSGQVVPLVIVGEGWSQQITLTNLDRFNREITGSIQFFRQSGTPWELDLLDRGRTSVVEFKLQRGQSVLVETAAKEHAQELGWAMISLQQFEQGDFGGQTIYRKASPGRPDLMTSTPLASRAWDLGGDTVNIFFDNRAGKFAGIAAVVSTPCPANCPLRRIQFRVKDLQGNLLASAHTDLRNGQMLWFSLTEALPELNGQVGTIEMFDGSSNSDRSYLSGFSLQFEPNGAFTSITSFEIDE